MFGKATRTDLHDYLFGAAKTNDAVHGAANSGVDTVTNSIGSKFDSIAVLDSTIGGTSTEEWAVSKTIVSPCTILLGADISIEVQSGASNLLVNPQGLFAIGPIIDLG